MTYKIGGKPLDEMDTKHFQNFVGKSNEDLDKIIKNAKELNSMYLVEIARAVRKGIAKFEKCLKSDEETISHYSKTTTVYYDTEEEIEEMRQCLSHIIKNKNGDKKAQKVFYSYKRIADEWFYIGQVIEWYLKRKSTSDFWKKYNVKTA